MSITFAISVSLVDVELPMFPVWAILVLPIIGGLVFYFTSSYREHTSKPTEFGIRGHDLEPNLLVFLAQERSLHLDEDDFEQFIRFFFDPKIFYERISETVEPLTRSVSITRNYTITASVRRGGSVALPLKLQQGHETMNGLRLTDSEGRRISSMSRKRTITEILAFTRLGAEMCSESATAVYDDQLEKRVAALILQSGTNTEEDILNVQNDILSLPVAGAEYEWIRSAVARLISLCATEYPLCVEMKDESVPERGRGKFGSKRDERSEHSWRLTLRERVIFDYNDRKMNSWKKLEDLVRHSFGIRPLRFSIPLTSADLTESYHMQVVGPEYTYLARQEIISRTKTGDLGLLLTTSAMAQARLGQRHAHLYVRNGDIPSNSYFSVRFYERMPGSIGRSSMSALSAAALIWLGYFAYLVPVSGDSEKLIPSWEFAALVLAFPSAIALWTGMESNRVLSEGVLISRVTTLITIGLSTLAAWHNIADIKLNSIGWLQVPQFDMWTLLAFLASLNAIGISISWMYRSYLQRKFVDGL